MPPLSLGHDTPWRRRLGPSPREEARQTLADQSDADLVARMALGDEASLSELHKRYNGELRAFATATAGAAEARAVVQEVFVELWNRRREVTADPSLRAYLFRATRTRALDNVRGRHRWTARFKSLDMVRSHAAETNPPDSSPLATAVARVEATLPARQREAFGLYYRHGLTYVEVGTVMGVSWGVVRNYVYLATQTVRKKMPQDLLADYFADAS
ncbi:MAG: sigma-70 family RNA polymerase sigma factor [Bacteroidota bacterium]